MPRSVQIPTPRPSRESLIKRLRIPKARQKELLAIMREPDADESATPEMKQISRSRTFRPGEDLQRAAASR